MELPLSIMNGTAGSEPESSLVKERLEKVRIDQFLIWFEMQ
jgi:hypothetical protein